MKKIIIGSLWLCAITLLVLATCSDSPINNTPPGGGDGGPVTSISLTNPGTIEVDGTGTISAILDPPNATNKNVDFTVSPSGVVNMSGSGTSRTLTGVKVGTATVTVTSEDGPTASREVEVAAPIPVTSVTINMENTDPLEVNKTRTLTVTIKPDTAKKDVKWESEDDKIATVIDGVVTGKAPGTVTITATSEVTKTRDDYVTITVIPSTTAPSTPSPVTKIQVWEEDNGDCVADSSIIGSLKTIVIASGATRTLDLSIFPTSTATNNDLDWTSNVPAMATVEKAGKDKIKVSGIKEGIVFITGTSRVDKDLFASFPVDIKKVVILDDYYLKDEDGNTLPLSGTELKIGTPMTLTASVDPFGAIEAVNWSVSSGSKYAKVESKGIVDSRATAILTGLENNGTAAIKLTSAGFAFSKTYSFDVKQPLKSLELKIDKPINLNFTLSGNTVTFKNGYGKTTLASLKFEVPDVVDYCDKDLSNTADWDFTHNAGPALAVVTAGTDGVNGTIEIDLSSSTTNGEFYLTLKNLYSEKEVTYKVVVDCIN